jgi:signal transduction histidine kinase
VDLRFDGLPKTSQEKSQALYRIMQEALSNVSRHSRASKVVVDLRGSHDNITLSIEDDGCGFDLQEVYAGVGLRSMRERAERFSGLFRVESAPGRGTRVCVEIPV